MDKSKPGKLRQTTTAIQIRKRREQRTRDSKQRNSADIELITGDGRFRRAHSSEWDTSRDGFHTGTSGRTNMQTLDKRISASTDQLDTLRERREVPRFRSSHKLLLSRETDLNENDVIFKYKGEQYSKNQYFFGDQQKQKEQEPKKTPFEMFLEDDGPYSRKLFGPPPPTQEEKNNKKKLSESGHITNTSGHTGTSGHMLNNSGHIGSSGHIINSSGHLSNGHGGHVTSSSGHGGHVISSSGQHLQSRSHQNLVSQPERTFMKNLISRSRDDVIDAPRC